VCEVMEQYIKEEIVERVKLMISDGKSKEEILKYFSEEEYAAAEAELLQPV